eukprot:scaffold41210_cov66-Phaeocystis_antarctica.AAC.16
MKLSVAGEGGGEGGQLRRKLHVTSMMRTRRGDTTHQGGVRGRESTREVYEASAYIFKIETGSGHWPQRVHNMDMQLSR